MKYYLRNPIIVSATNFNKLTDFLNQHPDNINIKDHKNRTLLHLALKRSIYDEVLRPGVKEIILRLLSDPAIDLSIQDDEGNTALHKLIIECSKKNYLEAHELLALILSHIKHFPINHEILNNDGLSVLHLAALTNYPYMSYAETYQPTRPTPIAMLLSTFNNPGIDVLSTAGATALGYATKKGAVTDMQALITAGANPALHQYSDYNVLEMIPDFLEYVDFQLMLSDDPEVTDMFETAKARLQQLIEAIKLTMPAHNRFSALLQMDVRDVEKTVTLDPSILTTQDEIGMTLYHHLAYIKEINKLNVQVADYLLNQDNVNLSLQDYALNTPIHYILMRLAENRLKSTFHAVNVTYAGFINLLNRTGFDFGLINTAKSSVYHLASPIKYKIDGLTPLRSLLKGAMYHPVIDAYNKDGETALTLACRKVRKGNIETLINLGARGYCSMNINKMKIDPYEIAAQRRDHYFHSVHSGLLTPEILVKNEKRLKTYSIIFNKMEYPSLLQEQLAYQEIGRTAATLSQGMRPGHIINCLPKEALIKFSIFSTQAHFGSQARAEKVATESLGKWLAVKARK